MSTLLTLTLAGSCMMFFYLAFYPMLRSTAKGRRIWLTLAAFFYLIPLYELKRCYMWALNKVSARRWYFGGVRFSEWKDYVEVQSENAVYRNTFFQLQTLLYTVWVAVAVIVLVYNLIRYFRRKSVFLNVGEWEEDERQLAMLDELRKDLKIHRRVRLLYCYDISPVSMGLMHPVILLPERMKGNIPKTLLRHELAHIKNLDILMRVLLTVAKAIHWFNPLVYLLQKEFEKTCELLCDETAVRGCSTEERADYAAMLIAELKYVVQSFVWAQHLSKDTKEIEERIKNIMEQKRRSKMRKCIGAVALTVSVFACSLTAFAYEDVHDVKADDGILMENIMADEKGNVGISDMEALVFENEDEMLMLNPAEAEIDEVAILYAEQFIDEDGNIYEVHADVQPYLQCDHELKSGTYARHVTYKDGHCKVEYYNAEWCVKCGDIWVHDYINTVTYAICPHS